MERGSSKHGSRLDDELSEEAEPLDRSAKESHVEEHLEKEYPGGHRVRGSGTSTEEHPYKDHGDEGGREHPRP
jgi:hypothetical protein